MSGKARPCKSRKMRFRLRPTKLPLEGGRPLSGLNQQSATTLARGIATGDVSAAALVKDCIATIERTNAQVNAVVTTNYEEALEKADAADRAVASGAGIGPLHGLPVLVKDLMDTATLRTTYGSACFADHVPASDAIIVEKLREAGAIILGKTNTPEFGAGANTRNPVFGATHNPFDGKVTAGGSSGGSAAALACDMAPLATGSDLGGSLRIPASYCSVVGMRPSPGIVPSRHQVSGFSTLWTDGPMARDVADVALMLSAISGFDLRDPLTSPASDLGFAPHAAPAELSRLRAGFSTDLGVADIERDIATVFETRKAVMAPMFGQSQDLDVDLSDATQAFRVLRAQSMYAAYGALVAEKGEEIGPNVRSNVADATTLSLADAAEADAAQTRIYRRFQSLFSDIDVLICPATAVSPFPITENHPTVINGVALDGYFAWFAITWALSLVGSPIVTIPCGKDHKGLPFGIQVVGARYQDRKVLQIAQALEKGLESCDIGRIRPPIAL